MSAGKVTPARERSSRFFANSALVIAALVVLSFPLTYFAPVVTGSKPFRLLHHLHGLAFFGWIALYVCQTQLALRGRIKHHRELGIAGAALAGAMLPLGLWLAVVAIERWMAEKSSLPFEFTLYNLVDIVLFSLFMAWGIFEAMRRIDWHRRLVFVAILNLLGAGISRWAYVLPVPFPFIDMAPNVVADLMLIALAMHDRRVLGRIHPATLIGAVVLVPLHVIEPLLARSAAWNALAPVLFGFS